MILLERLSDLVELEMSVSVFSHILESYYWTSSEILDTLALQNVIIL